MYAVKRMAWRQAIANFKEVEVSVGKYRVVWLWVNQWVNDEPVLSFNCEEHKEWDWNSIPNSTYQTNFTVDAPPMDLIIPSIPILEILELDPKVRLRILEKLAHNIGDPDACMGNASCAWTERQISLLAERGEEV